MNLNELETFLRSHLGWSSLELVEPVLELVELAFSGRLPAISSHWLMDDRLWLALGPDCLSKRQQKSINKHVIVETFY